MTLRPIYPQLLRALSCACALAVANAASAGTAGTETYIYDALGRLTNVQTPDSNQVSYQFDAAGNRLSVTNGNISDSGTLTQGTSNQSNGSVLVTIKGFGTSPPVGSYAPATLTGGKTVSAFQDYAQCLGSGSSPPPSCPTAWPNITSVQQASVSVSGFTTNPGAGWLVSATAGSVTRTSSAAAFTYSNGVAKWTWSGASNLFGFSGSGAVSTVIVHQP